jgi:hypothetical protein
MPEARKRTSGGSKRSSSKSGTSNRGRKSSERSLTTSRSRRNESSALVGKLGALGINQEMVEGVKTYVVHSVEGKLRGIDVQDAVEKVGEYAKRGLNSAKRYSSNRPGLFYGGLLTVALGAGLLIGAAIEREYEFELNFEPEED